MTFYEMSGSTPNPRYYWSIVVSIRQLYRFAVLFNATALSLLSEPEKTWWITLVQALAALDASTRPASP